MATTGIMPAGPPATFKSGTRHPQVKSIKRPRPAHMGAFQKPVDSGFKK